MHVVDLAPVRVKSVKRDAKVTSGIENASVHGFMMNTEGGPSSLTNERRIAPELLPQTYYSPSVYQGEFPPPVPSKSLSIGSGSKNFSQLCPSPLRVPAELSRQPTQPSRVITEHSHELDELTGPPLKRFSTDLSSTHSLKSSSGSRETVEIYHDGTLRLIGNGPTGREYFELLPSVAYAPPGSPIARPSYKSMTSDEDDAPESQKTAPGSGTQTPFSQPEMMSQSARDAQTAEFRQLVQGIDTKFTTLFSDLSTSLSSRLDQLESAVVNSRELDRNAIVSLSTGMESFRNDMVRHIDHVRRGQSSMRRANDALGTHLEALAESNVELRGDIETLTQAMLNSGNNDASGNARTTASRPVLSHHSQTTASHAQLRAYQHQNATPRSAQPPLTQEQFQQHLQHQQAQWQAVYSSLQPAVFGAYMHDPFVQGRQGGSRREE